MAARDPVASHIDGTDGKTDVSSFRVTLYNLNYGADVEVAVGEEKVAFE